MTTTFHISPDELNNEFLEKLRNIFGQKQLVITVGEEEDDTFYLLSSKSNRSKFSRSINELNNGDVISMTPEELRK